MAERNGTERAPAVGDGGPSWDLATRLEHALGDPHAPGSPFSWQKVLRHDRDASHPEEACAALDRCGLPAYYVPAEYGGALKDYGELHQLLRTVARRDPTVAAAHGKTFLAVAPVWVSGDHATARRIAAPVAAGARVSSGLARTEGGARPGGAPGTAGRGTAGLPGSGLSAYPTRTGYRLDGEEWLTGDVARSDFLSVLARTSPVPGPRAHSLLLLDTRDLAASACRPLPALPAHGLRGAGVSGAAFRDARIHVDTVVGSEGGGVEAMLKANQVTWAVRSAFSLGAADSALRTALRCADARTDGPLSSGNGPLSSGDGTLRGGGLSVEMRVLAEAYADVLLGEALGAVGVRSIHLLTGELSVTSAVVGFLVPALAAGVLDRQERTHRACRARPGRGGGYAPERHEDLWHDILGKLARDHRALSALGGGTLCLSLLVAQFRPLARGYLSPPDHRPRLARLFGLGQELPPLIPGRLTLLSRYGSAVLGTLPRSVVRLKELAREDPALSGAATLAAHLLAVADALHHRIAARPPTSALVSEESLADARAYALCFAGAACAGLWLGSGPLVGAGAEALWRDGLWLEACLARVLAHLGVRGPGPADDVLFGRLAGRLITQYEEGSLFSLLPCPTAEEPPPC